jgi:hypothetical protein
MVKAMVRNQPRPSAREPIDVKNMDNATLKAAHAEYVRRQRTRAAMKVMDEVTFGKISKVVEAERKRRYRLTKKACKQR